MGTKRFEQVDSVTGEVMDGFVAVIRPKQKSTFERHFTMNQDALLKLAKELKPEQIRVFLALLAHLDYENYIQVPQTGIMKDLGIQKANVSRAIRALLEKEVVLQGPKIGRSISYRLNPNYGWKGSISNHKKALKNGLSIIQGGR